MRNISRTALCASLGFAAMAMYAQEQRVSPHDQTSATVAGKKITITYGRPSMKGRQVFGDLVPYGEVWRTGADEATVLTTETGLTINDMVVPAGSYSVFTIPNENSWTLVLSKDAKQWGAFKYDQSQDLGRTAMSMDAAPSPVETFTIMLEPKGDNGGEIKMMWGNAMVHVPFTVKEMEASDMEPDTDNPD